MSVDFDDPIPALTVDLIPWLDARFPAQSPISLQNADHLEDCLKRGAIRELIAYLRLETSPED